MATFTEGQRVKIRFYTGWPERFHQSDRGSSVEQAMNAIDSKPTAEANTQVLSLLTDLDSVWTKLKDAHARLKAMKVGSITLSGGGEIGMLRSEGRRNVAALTSMLGISAGRDVFGAPAREGGNYYQHG